MGQPEKIPAISEFPCQRTQNARKISRVMRFA
jgi:hypothetical protein